MRGNYSHFKCSFSGRCLKLQSWSVLCCYQNLVEIETADPNRLPVYDRSSVERTWFPSTATRFAENTVGMAASPAPPDEQLVQVCIPTAGRGSRMGGFCDTLNKALLPMPDGRAIISHIFDRYH